jgi:MFS family permease
VLAGVGGVVGWSRAFAGRPGAAGPVSRSLSSRIPLGILLLGAIAALSLLSESTLESWSAIYLRAALGLPAVLGAAGPAIFHFSVLLGRLGSGRVIARVGRRGQLTWGGLLAAGGVALALVTTEPPVILAGLLVAGLAVAGIIPAAFSLAGDLAPDRAGAASSLVGLIGYLGPLIGPAMIGGLAEVFGLRIALSTLILGSLFIALLSLRVAVAGPRPVPARATAERA